MIQLAALARAFASAATACAVCYGANDYSGLKDGLSWGLLILLTATFSIVITLGWAVVRMERRKAAADAAALRVKAS